MNAIYAPVGILFKIEGKIQTVDPPAGVDLSNGLDEFTRYDDKGKAIMTTEEKALLGDDKLRTPTDDDIEVYYVNYLSINGKPPGHSAEAFEASNVPDAKYADSIISRGATAYTTLAHEIGHVLMDAGGHPDGNLGVNIDNLMAAPSQLNGQVTDSRRITATQAAAMLSKRPNLLSNP